MKINLFNLSFEDSKKYAVKKIWINSKLDVGVNIWGELIIRLGGLIYFFSFYLLEYAAIYAPTTFKNVKMDYVAPNTGYVMYQISTQMFKPIRIVLFIILGLTFFFEMIWFFSPRVNFIRYKIKAGRWGELLVIGFEISFLPLTISLAIANGGVMLFILEVIFLLLFAIYLVVKNSKSKLVTKVFKRIFSLKGIAIFIGILTAVYLINAITQGIPINFYSYLCSIFFVFLYSVVIYWNNFTFYIGLTFHYINKYPNEYRVYYKIPDDLWYFTKKNAAKHERVYPIPGPKE